MKKILTGVAILGFLMTGPAFAAKYFKWTDAKGVTHYSETPPPPETADARDISTVKVQTKLPSDSERATEQLEKQRAEAAKATQKASGTPAPAPAVDKSQYAERCKKLQDNLKAMEEHAQVREQDEKGEYRVLTDEEKTARMDATKREIKGFCD
ncbi:MAG: DUF4124 domain-containing protein [Moraxellaceae bacterium]|nr:DUF4124 domain-containing protein [Moraxellaceae bacterium]